MDVVDENIEKNGKNIEKCGLSIFCVCLGFFCSFAFLFYFMAPVSEKNIVSDGSRLQQDIEFFQDLDEESAKDYKEKMEIFSVFKKEPRVYSTRYLMREDQKN